MIKAVVFDMYETLITLFNSRVYKGKQIAEEMNIPEAEFRKIWDPSEEGRTLGEISFEEVIEEILMLCPSLGSSSVESALKKLVDEGYLVRIGSGRNTMYVRGDAFT